MAAILSRPQCFNEFIMAYWRNMAPGILVNIGSGNGSLVDNKPLFKLMLIYCQFDPWKQIIVKL